MPSVLVAVAYKVLPESPRFLSVMERHDEAALVRNDSYCTKLYNTPALILFFTL